MPDAPEIQKNKEMKKIEKVLDIEKRACYTLRAV